MKKTPRHGDTETRGKDIFISPRRPLAAATRLSSSASLHPTDFNPGDLVVELPLFDHGSVTVEVGRVEKIVGQLEIVHGYFNEEEFCERSGSLPVRFLSGIRYIRRDRLVLLTEGFLRGAWPSAMASARSRSAAQR